MRLRCEFSHRDRYRRAHKAGDSCGFLAPLQTAQVTEVPAQMDASETMRRLRYALEIDDAQASRLIVDAGGEATAEQVAGWRTRPDQPGHVACSARVVRQLMDGLIANRRGAPDPNRPRPAAPLPTGPLVDNNELLKSLRIALSLQAESMREIFLSGGATVSQSEVAALLRKPGTRNFRRCGDQLLRQFLNGLGAGRTTGSSTGGESRRNPDESNASPSPWPSGPRRPSRK